LAVCFLVLFCIALIWRWPKRIKVARHDCVSWTISLYKHTHLPHSKHLSSIFLNCTEWTKMFKLNLHNNTVTTCDRNTSLLKHGFRVKVCRWYAQIVHLAFPCRNCRRETSGTLLSPTSLFTTFSHRTPFQSCCNMPICRLGFSYGPRMMVLLHIFFSLFGYSRRTCFRNMCSTRWTNSMACFFPWLQYPIFWSVGTPEFYCLWHWCQWSSGLGTNTVWIWDDSLESWRFRASVAVAVRTLSVLHGNSTWTRRESSFIFRRL